ncbi:5-formyltetrahydrofolate cyclo-ligase [Aerococcaceae bacterium zg-BR9]|uniref:5-formyltetrahydrofolate cyclo-ligase n=1 Tax=Aerococcaceae bacterium zg-1292 TaxID=2774330 RepID=UPI004064597D|nr:5-formyltetrahydrofolate cyclo-ligase [Aerococcaceae bacterium zg-BR9]MBF6977854.1 5-formyltetrahydrofolate cyclo-ligase [Aerococcaceae bacterium zg-BR22]
MTQLSKNTLRQSILQKLSNLDETLRKQWEYDLYQQLIDEVKLHDYQSIACIYSMEPEINFHPLIGQLQQMGCDVYLPCIEANYQLCFRQYCVGDSLKRVFKSIYQPLNTAPQRPASEIDLIIVPGLLFNQSGYRIGFGGGYYDRLLARYSHLNTISLAFPIQVTHKIDLLIEPHDRRIKHLIIAQNSY